MRLFHAFVESLQDLTWCHVSGRGGMVVLTFRRASGMVFSSRQFECKHLWAGSPLCLLGLLLRVPHFSEEEEKEHTEATIEIDRRLKSTRKAGAAIMPAFRRPWVPWQFIDLESTFVDLCGTRPPCRSQRVHDVRFDGASNE